jgi:hypothetical protein
VVQLKCTSVSNPLSSLDASGYQVRVLSLTSLLAIARVCDGSSICTSVLNVLSLLDADRYEVRVLSLLVCVVARHHLHECFKSSFLVGYEV